MKAAIDCCSMNEHGYVPIKHYFTETCHIPFSLIAKADLGFDFRDAVPLPERPSLLPAYLNSICLPSFIYEITTYHLLSYPVVTVL